MKRSLLLATFALIGVMLFAKTVVQVSTKEEMYTALMADNEQTVQLTADLKNLFSEEKQYFKGIKVLDLNGHSIEASCQLMAGTSSTDKITITGNGTWKTFGDFAFRLANLKTLGLKYEGNLIIENGTFNFDGNAGFFLVGISKNCGTVKVTVNGGRFNLNSKPDDYTRLIYSVLDENEPAGPELTINGGVFVMNKGKKFFGVHDPVTKVTINGGTFWQTQDNVDNSFSIAASNVKIGEGKVCYIGGIYYDYTITGLNLEGTNNVYARLMQVGDSESDFVSVSVYATAGGSAVLDLMGYQSYKKYFGSVLRSTPIALTATAIPDDSSIPFNGWSEASNTTLTNYNQPTVSFSVRKSSLSMKAFFGDNIPKYATNPANLPAYYKSSIDGKKAEDLVTNIATLCHDKYVGVSYYDVWTAYATTDIYPDDYVATEAEAQYFTSEELRGQIWDMYGTCCYTYRTNQGASASTECGGGYNREHSVPKSWFGIKSNDLKLSSYTGPGTDLHHLFPTDVHVNSDRSNYPFGEVAQPTTTYKNGSKLGPCTFPTDFGGTVFEPADEYKGDFARVYMYMVLTWDKGAGIKFTQDSYHNGEVTFNDSFAAEYNWGLTDYGKALLMKWHLQDPVSRKEIDRNNAVEVQQGNRNPFVDYPELANYIWGDKNTTAFDQSKAVATFSADYDPQSSSQTSTTPEITVPKSFFLGYVANGKSFSRNLTIKAANLTEDITLTKSGSDHELFTIDKTSLGKDGGTITITFSPTLQGDYDCTLTIQSGDTKATVELYGKCKIVHSVTWMVNGEVYATTQVDDGNNPELPNAPEDNWDCWEGVDSSHGDKEYFGWTDTPIDGETSTTPVGLFNETTSLSAMPIITENTTFHMVMANKEIKGGGSSTKESITFGDEYSEDTALDGETVTIGTNSSVAFAKADGSTAPKYYKNGTAARIYAGNTMTFTSSGDNISKIALTISQGDNELSMDAGSYSDGTWTGNAKSVTFTVGGTKGHLRITKIEVTVGGGETVIYSNYSTGCPQFDVPFIWHGRLDPVTDQLIYDTIAVVRVNYGDTPEFDGLEPEYDVYYSENPALNPYITCTFIGWSDMHECTRPWEGGCPSPLEEFPSITNKFQEFYPVFSASFKNFPVEFEGYPEKTQYLNANPMIVDKHATDPGVTPEMLGYDFIGWTTVDDPDTRLSGHAPLFSFEENITGPLILYQAYKPGKTPFTVNRYYQQLSDVNNGGDITTAYYILGKSDQIMGVTDEWTDMYFIPSQDTIGFAAPTSPNSSMRIDAGGYTSVDLFYDRLQYKVTWDFRGGKLINDEWTYTTEAYYDTYLRIPMIEMPYYDFVKWVPSDPDMPVLDNDFYGELKMPAHDVTYTAVWTGADVIYSVKHCLADLDGKIDTDRPEIYQLFMAKVGETVQPEVFDIDNPFEGYEAEVMWFTGFKKPEVQDYVIQPIDNNEVVYTYLRNTYKLTYDLDGGHWPDGYDATSHTQGDVLFGAPINKPENPEKEDKIFYGWENEYNQMPHEDVVVKATWGKTIRSLSVTFASTVDGDDITSAELRNAISIDVEVVDGEVLEWAYSDMKGLFADGSTLRFRITNGEYSFDHFGGDLSGTDLTFTITKDMNIVVYCTPSIYKVLVECDKNLGQVSVSGTTEFTLRQLDDPSFESIHVTATVTNSEYEFKGWVCPYVMTEGEMTEAEVLAMMYAQYQDILNSDPGEMEPEEIDFYSSLLAKIFMADATVSGYELSVLFATFFPADTENNIVLRAVFAKKDQSTGLNSTSGTVTQPMKLLIDGHIYILRDGKLFNITGQTVF